MTDPKDELRNRFQDHVGGKGDSGEMSDTEQSGDTGHTDTADDTDGTGDAGDTGTTRNRSQYAMYLSEELQTELNRSFERFNAQRVLDDLEKIEKHRHFLEGVVRAGLDHPDLDAYVGPNE